MAIAPLNYTHHTPKWGVACDPPLRGGAPHSDSPHLPTMLVVAGSADSEMGEQQESLVAPGYTLRGVWQVLHELVFKDPTGTVTEANATAWALGVVKRLVEAMGRQVGGIRVIESILLGWVTKGKTRERQRGTDVSVTIFLHVWRRVPPGDEAAPTQTPEWREKFRLQCTEHWRRWAPAALPGELLRVSGSARLVQDADAALPTRETLTDWATDGGTADWEPPGWADAVQGGLHQNPNFRSMREHVLSGRRLEAAAGRVPSAMLPPPDGRGQPQLFRGALQKRQRLLEDRGGDAAPPTVRSTPHT